MNPLLIFGAGQVAQTFADYVKVLNRVDLRRPTLGAFVVDGDHMTDAVIGGIPVVAFEDVAATFEPAQHHFLVGLSFKGVNALRQEKYEAMRKLGYKSFTYIDPAASLSDTAKVGVGCMIMDENTIQPYAWVGNNVVLWSGNHVGHHASIEDHVFVASHAVISGAVEIGERSFIGVNATIRDNVKIGPRCVIGAGALILSDCEADGVYSPGATERSRVPSNRLRGI